MLLVSATFTGAASSAPPALSDPTQLTWVRTGGSANCATGSLSPSSDSLLVLVHRTRNTASIAHNTPTTTLANMNDFGGGAEFSKIAEIESAAGNYLRCSMWVGFNTGSPGSGTITGIASGVSSENTVEVIELTGFNSASLTGATATANSTSGTSIAFTMSGTPLTDSVVIAAMHETGDDADSTAPSGFTEMYDSVLNFVKYYTCWKKGSVASGPHTITSLRSSPITRALCAIEIKRAV